MFGIKDGIKGMKFEFWNFEFFVIVFDVDENFFGKYKMDFIWFFFKFIEGCDEENDCIWIMSFKFVGKVSGGILVFIFGC